MTEIYKALAVDAYINAKAIIENEREKVSRMMCRAMNGQEVDTHIVEYFLKDAGEYDTVIKAYAYYEDDNDWGFAYETEDGEHYLGTEFIYDYYAFHYFEF